MAFLVLGFAFLSACGDWKTDPQTLTAKTETVSGMACNACHAYPPPDSNHLYHLYQTVPDKFVNGPITCLSCHRNSLRAQAVAVPDTFFRNPDPLGDIPQVSSLNYPVTSPADTFSIRARSWPIDSVVLRPQTHPVPQAGRAVPDSGLADFMTGLAHLNGSIDVIFDPKHSNPARFGDSASFNPRQETCSAVACHPGDGGAWRFGAPGKGLPGLRE